MPNIKMRAKQALSPFRKMAIGTWRRADNPTVYGAVKLHMDEALRYIDEFRAATGRRLTVTHLMGRAMAQVLAENPDANAILRFNRLYLRDEISIFFQVAMEDEESGEIDLSGTVLRSPEKMTLIEIIDRFERGVDSVREGTDDKESTRQIFKYVPGILLNRILDTIAFFSFDLNLDLRWAGVPRDPFGSLLITNIGSLGLEEAYPPLVPYSRVPMLVCTGAIEETPVCKDGEITTAKIMRASATFDHRVLDGKHAVGMISTLRRWMENPFEHFDPIPATASEGSGEAHVPPEDAGEVPASATS